MLPTASIERTGMLFDSSTTITKFDAAKTDSTKGTEQDNIKCDYCGKPRHTRDTCWKLHGRPMHDRGGKRFGGTRPRAHMSETLDAKMIKETCTSSGLSDGELQTL